MTDLFDVVSIQPLSGYRLALQFDNGEKRIFDMTPYMDRKPFNRLSQPGAFDQPWVENGTVVWLGNIDIAPETLYEESGPIEELP